MHNEINLSFSSIKSNISVIRNMLGAMLVEYNPTLTFVNELKTVVSEAVTNCIVHGYEGKIDEFIDMKIIIDVNCIAIDIVDYGIGIEDVKKAKEPLFSTKQDEERSGLGFTIMELFCDKLIVESKLNEGTKVHLEKIW